MRVAVIGAGSWGTANALHLARLGHEVLLWAYERSAADFINAEHRNPSYLIDCEFPDSIRATSDYAEAIVGSDAVVFVVPSFALRTTARNATPYIGPSTPVIVLTKGIEENTSCLMTEVVAQEIGNPGRIAALSGPNHAEEVSHDVASATVIAAQDADIAAFFQGLFHSDTFRTYVSDDVVGVEVCSAAKNVVAIACGIVKGYGGGDNTVAMIMTRGLAEISRLVVARGGNALTCMGLAGMGDLIATCTSQHSRNATFGKAFAGGESLESYQARTHMVVEGALACKSVRTMAQKLGVEAPLTEAVCNLLYEGMSYDEVMQTLFARNPNIEFYGI